MCEIYFEKEKQALWMELSQTIRERGDQGRPPSLGPTVIRQERGRREGKGLEVSGVQATVLCPPCEV